jgi:methylthioribose-1-phosphate isomerase
VSYVWGRTDDGRVSKVRISPDGTDAANYAFDVTPARLVTGLITERGVCAASSGGLRGLFREHAASPAAS